MVIALILIGYFADIYTKHEYRSGFRIKSQDHLESGDDPLLIKFEGTIGLSLHKNSFKG